MPNPPDFSTYIALPVEVYNKETLAQVYDALRNVQGATTSLNASNRQFIEALREQTIESKSLAKALVEIGTGATGASASHQKLAADLREYIIQTQAAAAITRQLEQEITRTTNAGANYASVFGRIGGRIGGAAVLGSLGGIPGGGFIGSQLIQGLGLSGGAALGVGVAGVGAFGAYELYKKSEEQSKQAIGYGNLSKETGMSVEELQVLGRIAESTGIQTTGLLNVVKDLTKSLVAGGEESKHLQRSLADLGLDAGIAFESPQRQLEDIMAALKNIPSTVDRARIAVSVFGEAGRQLLPLVDSFQRLSDAARGSGNIMSANTIAQFEILKAASQSINESWQGSWTAVSLFVEKLKVGAELMMSKNAHGLLGMFGVAETPEKSYPTGKEVLDRRNTSGAEEMVKNAGIRRLAEVDMIDAATGTPVDQARRYLKNAQEDQTRAEQQYKEKGSYDVKMTGPGGTPYMQPYNNASGLNVLGGRVTSAESAVKTAERRQQQQQELASVWNKINMGDISAADAGRTLISLDRLDLMRGDPEFRKIQGNLQWMTIQAAQEEGTQSINRTIGREIDPLYYLQEHLQAPGNRGMSESRSKAERDLRDLEKEYRIGITDSTNGQGIDLAQTNLNSSIAASLRIGQRGTVDPITLQRRALSQSLSQIGAESSIRTNSLRSQQSLADSVAAGLPTTGEGGVLREQLEEQSKQKGIEIQTQEIDARIKSIDAINKFNTSLVDAALRIDKEFASDITGVLLSAQNDPSHAGTAALGSLRKLGTSWEKTILENAMGPGLLGLHAPSLASNPNSTFGKLLQNTPFGSRGGPEVQFGSAVSKFDIAVDRLLGARSGTGGFGGGGFGSPVSTSDIMGGLAGQIQGYGMPTFAAASDIASAIGSPSVSGMASSAGRDLGLLAKAFRGGTGPNLFNQLLTGDGPAKSVGQYGDTVSYNSTTNSLAAAASIAGAAAGAAAGITMIAHGGAKNVAGGLAATLAAAGIVSGPAMPFVEGAAAIAGLVASFLPDPRSQRAQAMQDTMFNSQYLAAPTQNVMMGTNGGYADVDFMGHVRSSNLSPYPQISDPYLDVPRRTVVPGHTISQFGGPTGTPGALVTPTPPKTITINAIDSESLHNTLMRNSGAVVSAFHHGLNDGHGTEMVHTLAQHLGLR